MTLTLTLNPRKENTQKRSEFESYLNLGSQPLQKLRQHRLCCTPHIIHQRLNHRQSEAHQNCINAPQSMNDCGHLPPHDLLTHRSDACPESSYVYHSMERRLFDMLSILMPLIDGIWSIYPLSDPCHVLKQTKFRGSPYVQTTHFPPASLTLNAW